MVALWAELSDNSGEHYMCANGWILTLYVDCSPAHCSRCANTPPKFALKFVPSTIDGKIKVITNNVIIITCVAVCSHAACAKSSSPTYTASSVTWSPTTSPRCWGASSVTSAARPSSSSIISRWGDPSILHIICISKRNYFMHHLKMKRYKYYYTLSDFQNVIAFMCLSFTSFYLSRLRLTYLQWTEKDAQQHNVHKLHPSDLRFRWNL